MKIVAVSFVVCLFRTKSRAKPSRVESFLHVKPSRVFCEILESSFKLQRRGEYLLELCEFEICKNQIKLQLGSGTRFHSEFSGNRVKAF